MPLRDSHPHVCYQGWTRRSKSRDGSVSETFGGIGIFFTGVYNTHQYDSVCQVGVSYWWGGYILRME